MLFGNVDDWLLIFGGIEEEMPYGNPGFDYIVNGGFKVDIKSTRLANNTWNFAILNNDKADYFVLMRFNNPENEDDLILLGPGLGDGS